ncbi:MarR family winged helix-turn-helix transcriptional regulator [Actinoplanes sp. NPDC000266]
MTIAFGPQLIGRTEKSLNALLARELAGTGVTEPQWVALTLAVVSPGDIAAIREALKVDEPGARRELGALASLGLVDPIAVEATAEGRALWQRIRAATTQIADELFGDLPEDDLRAAGRVLNAALTRADAMFAAGPAPR